MYYKNIEDGSAIKGPLTDETALLIIPCLGGHGIFRILREHGASIEEAVLCVLSIQIGDNGKASEILVKYGLEPLENKLA